MKKSELLRKILAASLAVTVIGGVSIATPISSMIGANITVSAASASPVVTVGDFQYVLYSDKTARVVGYTGTKNLSTAVLAMPTVIYSKDIDTTWSYNQYIASYDITQMQAGIFNGCTIKLLSLPQKLQTVIGGFTGALIGGFNIATTNSYFSTGNNINALYNKSGTTLYAYPSKQSLYNTSYGTSAVLLNTLARVEDQAFANCQLTTVTLPSSVTYMGDRVFTGSHVCYVTMEGDAPTFRFLPGSNFTDHGTFEGASTLYQINIKGTNGNYTTDAYGNLYNKDKTKLILVPQGKTSAFNVAPTCTEIGDYAFYHSNCNGPVIYDQVKTIGGSAFYGVKSNFKVYCLKDTATDTFVKNNSIPYTYAYEYTTANNNVTITKYNGPYNSPSVPTSINGKNVVAIGESAFKGKTSLTAVYLYSPIAAIGKEAFYGCSKLTRVSIPSTVTNIGERAFYNCSSISTFSLPSKLQTIGNSAFAHCGAVTSLNIPGNVSSIGQNAFYNCTSLSSLTLNNGLKSIGSSAFENTALTSVDIPETVTFIGTNAFGYHYENSTHTRVAFDYISGYPDSSAETYAKTNNIPFKSCFDYSVNTNGTTVSIDKYNGSDADVTIPDTIAGKTVTAIKSNAFSNTKVTTVRLPESITSLNSYAFYGARNLQTIFFPSNLTSIGDYAFEFCSSLQSLTFPSSLRQIGYGAFYGCEKLSLINLNQGLERIGRAAFTNTALTSVTFPQSILKIDNYAFGYNYTNSQQYTPVEPFKIKGYVDTPVEDYALNNPHITFEPMYTPFSGSISMNAESIELGETVTIHAAGTGGKKPYQYRAEYLMDGASSWQLLQDYSEKADIPFKPSAAGTYTIKIFIMDNRGTYVTRECALHVTALTPLTNNSTISKTTITLGESVIAAGKASGGKTPYLYGVYYKKTTSTTWTTAQSYKSNAKVTITPKAAVPYDVCVKVKDATGKIEKKYFVVEVVKPLTNHSTISAETIKKGQSVIVTGKAADGKTPYLYGVYYKKTTSETWTTAQSYKANAVVKVTPVAAVKYDVCAKVKDATGKIEKKYFVVTVTK